MSRRNSHNHGLIAVENSHVAIAVMGATGSGKTTFINLASGSDLRIGMGLQSCTSIVQVSKPFVLGRRTITLIDTPGFDDTTRSDTDILRMIAAFLATSYEHGKKLAGVIYVHRISDFRMGGVSTRNFKMFRQLCGESTLRNVVIVTNMWGEVSRDVGESREAELVNQEIFFKPVLDKAALMMRHENTQESAHHILLQIIDNHPLPLRIQRELVDQGKDISQTAAGAELNRELMEQIQVHKREMRELEREMREAIQAKDEETKEELEQATRKLQAEMNRVQSDAQKLASEYTAEKQRMDARLQQLQDHARQEQERARGEHERQMAILQKQLSETRSSSSGSYDEDLRREIAEMRSGMRPENEDAGFFAALGASIGATFGALAIIALI